MSDDLRFKDLRDQNSARCAESFYPIDSRSPTDWACALAEETGEVARLCKRVRDGVLTEEMARGMLKLELGDVVMYLDLLAARFEIDLGEAVRHKFNVVSERVGSTRRL